MSVYYHIKLFSYDKINLCQVIIELYFLMLASSLNISQINLNFCLFLHRKSIFFLFFFLNLLYIIIIFFHVSFFVLAKIILYYLENPILGIIIIIIIIINISLFDFA